MTQNRLVRKKFKGKVTASLTKWSANSEANEWTFNLRKGINFMMVQTLMPKMLNIH